MVVVDQQVRFDAFQDMDGGNERLFQMVTGTVYSVNYAHNVFHVEYEAGGQKQRTSFNFCDIGEKVQVV